MVKALGTKLSVAATVTVWASPVSPGEDALMIADPRLTPVTCAGVSGVVARSGMKMEGVTVNFEVSLLVSVIVTPPLGAGETRLTFIGTGWPGATVGLP